MWGWLGTAVGVLTLVGLLIGEIAMRRGGGRKGR